MRSPWESSSSSRRGHRWRRSILVFGAYAIVDGILLTALGLAVPFSSRWLLVVAGVLAIGFGVYTVLNPGVTAAALAVVIGLFAIVRGTSEAGYAIARRGQLTDAWLYVLSGVISIVFGAFLVAAPSDGAVALLFVIGSYALFAGVMYLAIGVRLRGIDKQLTAASTASTAAS